MKGRKILVALDGSPYSESATEHAIQMFREDDTEQETLLVGVYINSLHYGDLLQKVKAHEPLYFSYHSDVFEFDEYAEDMAEKRKMSVEKFEERCSEANVKYQVHDHQGSPIVELLNESRFADLIVIGFQTYFASEEKSDDDDVIHELLKDAHCPVFVVPDKYQEIKNLLFTFDGKDSSFYAIKQFTYIFSLQASRKPVQVVMVSKNEEKAVPEKDERLLREFLEQHCNELEIKTLQGEPEKVIIDSLEFTEGPLLVMGSYGRSEWSMLFQASTADRILQYKQAPVFITHK